MANSGKFNRVVLLDKSRSLTGLWEVAPAFSLVLFDESAGAIQYFGGATAHPEVDPSYHFAIGIISGWPVNFSKPETGSVAGH
jgi:hypothetical protein